MTTPLSPTLRHDLREVDAEVKVLDEGSNCTQVLASTGKVGIASKVFIWSTLASVATLIPILHSIALTP